VELGGIPIGMVRFDREESDCCVISAYLTEEYVGRGLGVAAISMACEMVTAKWSVENILAHVRRENSSGLSGFRKAGFVPCEVNGGLEGHEVLMYACGESL
jgi:ribosomal protein S18 acetylase RimI-like enzyme